MKRLLILILSLPFTLAALGQKQDTALTQNTMIKDMLGSCCIGYKSIDTINKGAVPTKIKSYLKKIKYSIFFGGQGLRGIDSKGNVFYIVVAYPTGFVMDEFDYFYFDEKYRYIKTKSGVYFCDICF